MAAQNGSRRAGNAATQSVAKNPSSESENTRHPDSAQACRRHPRRMASPAERQQAREVAAFVAPRITDGESWLVILACVSRQSPDISLRTALTGYVFHDLLDVESSA
jgi:hypothetical protein